MKFGLVIPDILMKFGSGVTNLIEFIIRNKQPRIFKILLHR